MTKTYSNDNPCNTIADRRHNDRNKHNPTLPQLRTVGNECTPGNIAPRWQSRLDLLRLFTRSHSQTTTTRRQIARRREAGTSRARSLSHFRSLFLLLVGLALIGLLGACDNASDTTASLSVPQKSPTLQPTITPEPTPLPTIKPTPLPNCGEQTAVFDAYPAPNEVNIDTYTLINTFPHDSTAYTQGLQFVDGVFVEGTGIKGQSSLRYVELETGAVQKQITLGPDYFGEGVTVFEDRIYQITWQSQTAFVYDRESLTLEETFTYPTQGWGLTHNGRCLIMSDGSNTLYFRDPETFAELGRLSVFDNMGPVFQINELEYINGEIFANIWRQNRIARISPDTGQVIGWLALDDLVAQVNPTHPEDVLNGIAYDEENGRLFVTGKRWPTLFEIEISN
ncbi:MAG: glutaminyl-peptide cyclotransferase [Chloroflexi bacterium]|nr:MAG: glutaminyl-peptide cyclotransferase [Chloroflexota bacterium]